MAAGEVASGRPVGLEAINTACRLLYPDQTNPLQVTALIKYWLGGPDPLDYISMYYNRGNQTVPAHWHYITCGFSDLHGDGRIHEPGSADQPSGFGFELTFRLQCEGEDSKAPPTWPAELMQSLARYVFQSDNTLCIGDHISWHSSLDRGDSRIRHMLLAEDVQLRPAVTPLGRVAFIQVVGVTTEELDLAQKWNGPGVLDLLRRNAGTGGQWLITNMRRTGSLFDIDSSTESCADEGVSRDGSNLSGVSAVCGWDDQQGRPGSAHLQPPTATPPQQGHSGSAHLQLPSVTPPQQGHSGSAHLQLPSVTPPELGSLGEGGEIVRTDTLSRAQLKFNLEAAKLLPLALRGRLKHGRHFTFKSFTGEVAITLVCAGVEGTFADEGHPLACHGPWLQVFITEALLEQMLVDIEQTLAKSKLHLPHHLEWAEHHLAVTILTNE